MTANTMLLRNPGRNPGTVYFRSAKAGDASEPASEDSRKQYIGIYVYRDHLSFINHNRPVPPVTIEDLNTQVDFDDRHYLNDEIKEMFFKLDLIQSYGSGVRRAKKAMEDNKASKTGLQSR